MRITLDDVFNKISEGQMKELNIIIKADVQGSVEALKASLEKLSNNEVKVVVVHGGVGAINKWSRRKDMNYKQALCAIGQVELMMAYREFFADYGMHVAQILLTAEDFSSDERLLHIRNTLFTLIDEGVVPIVNENDTVSVDEIMIGDNDNLGALTANLWNADALVLLSDIDGIFDKDPKTHGDAALIETVTDIGQLREDIDITGKSDFGTGGIETKLQAAERAGEVLIPTLLLNGKQPDVLLNALEGKSRGTAFIWK
jgi:glutamate 5-kinase